MATERLSEKIGTVYCEVIQHRHPYVEYAGIRCTCRRPLAWCLLRRCGTDQATGMGTSKFEYLFAFLFSSFERRSIPSLW